MVVTAIAGETDNNQLKATAEERVAVATAMETAMAMEMVTVTGRQRGQHQ